jgi:hypothetical protein
MMNKTIGLLFASLLLQGCLLERLFTMRDQVCEFETYFAIGNGSSIDVTMLEPVLLESDVLLAMDAPATLVTNSDTGRIFRYVFEQLGSSQEAGDFREVHLDFEFVQVGEEFRLSRVRSSELPIAGSALQMELAPKMAAQACETEIGLFTRNYQQELDPALLEVLPDQEKVRMLLGPPLENLVHENGAGWVYAYRLKGSADPDQVVRFTAWFVDGSPVLLESSFARYRAQADLVTGLATTTFKF